MFLLLLCSRMEWFSLLETMVELVTRHSFSFTIQCCHCSLDLSKCGFIIGGTDLVDNSCMESQRQKFAKKIMKYGEFSLYVHEMTS